MFFVLGVLVATLVALMVLPAIWHRAVRLTTRRIEAAVPSSIFEIHADKDLQRAGFALNQRRLELQIEALRDQIMREARTLEEHRLAAVNLGHQLAARTQDNAVLQAERDDLAARLAQTQHTLEERVAALAEASVALAARDAELQEMRTVLADTRRSLSAQETSATSLSAALMEREAQLAQAFSEVSAHKHAAADALQVLEAERSGTGLELETLRLRLTAAQAAAQAATERAEALAQSGASAQDLSLVRQRLTEIADRIAAAGSTSTGPGALDQVPSAPIDPAKHAGRNGDGASREVEAPVETPRHATAS